MLNNVILCTFTIHCLLNRMMFVFKYNVNAMHIFVYRQFLTGHLVQSNFCYLYIKMLKRVELLIKISVIHVYNMTEI